MEDCTAFETPNEEEVLPASCVIDACVEVPRFAMATLLTVIWFCRLLTLFDAVCCDPLAA